MPLLGSATLIVLAVTLAVTLMVGWRRPFVMLTVLVLGVPLRDFVTRWLNVNTDLTIQTVTALGRWWFALVLGLLILLVIKLLLERRAFVEKLDLGWPDWLFIACGALVLILIPLSPERGAAFTSARGYLQPMAVYVLARAFWPSRRELRTLLYALLLLGVVIAAFGLWQGVIWTEADFRAAGYVRQDGSLVTPPAYTLGREYIRPASTVSGPNELGVLMVVLFGLAVFKSSAARGWQRAANVVLAMLFMITLLATFSRSALLGFGAALLGIVLLAGRRLWATFKRLETRSRRVIAGLALGGSLAAVLAFFLSGVDNLLIHTIATLSQQYHIVDTLDAIRYLAANPQGAGMGMVEPKGALSLIEAGGAYHVEGSLFQIAVEMSVAGLALWLAFWIATLAKVAKAWKVAEEPLLRTVTGTAFAGWIASLVAFVFLPLMQSISLMVWLWFLLGVGVAANRIEANWSGR